jgi:hypothetical protein
MQRAMHRAACCAACCGGWPAWRACYGCSRYSLPWRWVRRPLWQAAALSCAGGGCGCSGKRLGRPRVLRWEELFL